MNRRIAGLFFVVTVVFPLAVLAQSEDEHRAAVTLKRMDALAQAIETSIAKNHAVPESLSAAVANGVSLNDEWGTPFKFVKIDRESFEIISAGADRRFSEASWQTERYTSDFTADAVYVKSGRTAAHFRRSWVSTVGAPLLLSSEQAAANAEAMARQELEHTKGMTSDEAWNVIRSRGTIRTLSALAVIIERYKQQHGGYPQTNSYTELVHILLPETAADVQTKDWWGTEFRYEAAPDGKSYRLIAAGNDHAFDPASWDRAGPLATTDEDAVLRNGEWIRKWDEQTKPGLTAEQRRRLTLKPEARALLEKSDKLEESGKSIEALDTYVAAMKADPNAADLDKISTYSPAFSAPPPPPPPPGKAAKVDDTSKKIEQHQIAALREYLRIRPNEWEATLRLAALLPYNEAESLLAPFVKSRPDDPEVYAARGARRAREGLFDETLADYVKAQELDPKNPERYYIVGVIEYQAVKKQKGLTVEQKRDLIRRGLKALQQAEALKPEYFESVVYRNLLLREEAAIESDPAKQKELVAQADAIRQQAMDMIKRRKAAKHPANNEEH